MNIEQEPIPRTTHLLGEMQMLIVEAGTPEPISDKEDEFSFSSPYEVGYPGTGRVPVKRFCSVRNEKGVVMNVR